MLRKISSVMLSLGVVLASVSVGTSAFADNKAPQDVAPKNLSSSPRETIYELPDGTTVHTWIRNDGYYGMAIRDKNGNTTHYVINPKTGQMLEGTYETGTVPMANGPTGVKKADKPGDGKKPDAPKPDAPKIDKKPELPKAEVLPNLSSTKLVTDYKLTDGTHVHLTAMTDGKFLVNVSHTNGRHETFMINSKTHQFLPAPDAKGNVYPGATVTVSPGVLAVLKPLVGDINPKQAGPLVVTPGFHKPAVSVVSTTVGTPVITTRPTTAPVLKPAVTAVRPSTPAVATVNTTVGHVTIKSGPTTIAAVRPAAAMVNTTVGTPRISMAPSIAPRVPTITVPVRR